MGRKREVGDRVWGVLLFLEQVVVKFGNPVHAGQECSGEFGF